MSLKKAIIKNLGFVTLAEALSAFLSYFLIVILARNLGPSDLGIYSFAFAFAGIFTFVYDFGISYFYITSVSKDRSNAQKYFGQYALLKLLFCLLALALPLASLFFLDRGPHVNLIVFLAAISLFFQNYSYVARNTFSSFQQMKYEAATRISERVIAFIVGIYVLLAGYGLLAFMLVLVFSNFVSTLYSIYLLRRVDVRFSLKIDPPLWKKMLQTSWTFWLSSIFVIIYFQVDTIMLSFISGYEVAGFYNAAYKLINVLSRIPWILVFVLFPVMSQAHATMPKRVMGDILRNGMRLMLFVSFPLMIGTTLLASQIISFIYKAQFSSSILLLQILVWTTLFLFIGNMAGWFLNAVGKPSLFAYATGFCLLLNITLNAILIPLGGAIGASIATVITSVVNFLLLHYFVRKEEPLLGLAKLSFKPFLAALIMGIFILFIRNHVFFIITIFLGVAVYGLLLILLGGIKKEDFKGIL